MTKREEWTALAERCEKATGPDREIDKEIFLASGMVCEKRKGERREWFRWSGTKDDFDRYDQLAIYGYRLLPRITASIDAITALIERELPGREWAVWREGDWARAAIDPTKPQAIYADVATPSPSLALCAAFCRAKAEACNA